MLSTRTLQFLLKRGISQSLVLRSSAEGGHAGGMDLWRKLTYFGAFPAIILCAANVYLDVTSHPHEPPEFVPYEHMRIRTRKFPWGDGSKTLFHNPHVNALPDGYESGFGPGSSHGESDKKVDEKKGKADEKKGKADDKEGLAEDKKGNADDKKEKPKDKKEKPEDKKEKPDDKSHKPEDKKDKPEGKASEVACTQSANNMLPPVNLGDYDEGADMAQLEQPRKNESIPVVEYHREHPPMFRNFPEVPRSPKRAD